MTAEQILQILERAAGEEIGIAVEVSNVDYAIQRISAARKDKPQFASLIIAKPNIPNTIFIYHRTVSLDP